MEFKVLKTDSEIRINRHVSNSLVLYMRTHTRFNIPQVHTIDDRLRGARHVIAISPSTNVLYLRSDAKRRMNDEHRDVTRCVHRKRIDNYNASIKEKWERRQDDWSR